jgi:hypothetical protein
VTTKMPTHTGILDTPLHPASNCFVRDCSKPRFMGYYVCAEHFVFYASARYTESMVIKAEPIGVWCSYPEATSSSSRQREHTEPKPAEYENTGKARIA